MRVIRVALDFGQSSVTSQLKRSVGVRKRWRAFSRTPEHTMSNKMSLNKRAKIFSLCQGHCAYCGHKLDFFGTDWCPEHKIPQARGGGNELENLAPSCMTCNRRKNRFTPEEFRSNIGKRVVKNLEDSLSMLRLYDQQDETLADEVLALICEIEEWVPGFYGDGK